MSDLNIPVAGPGVAEADVHEIAGLEAKLRRLKELSLDEAAVSLWVVHRKLVRGVAGYSALKVDMEDRLRTKLRRAVTSRVDNANSVSPYEYLTDDLDDDRLLEQPTSTTDFSEVIELVSRNGEEFKVEQEQQLVGAWGYVVKLQVDDQYVYAFRKLGGNWSSKRATSGWSLLLRDRVLMDLEQDAVFKADSKIDFIGFEESVFILDKKNFESAMNFREGMEQHRDELLEEFAALDLFDDVDMIRQSVGSNLHRLRKLASVRKNGYYNLPWYMRRLKELNHTEAWGLDIAEDGKITVSEENVELILTLLNNDRLRSPITEETFDVAVKRPIEQQL